MTKVRMLGPDDAKIWRDLRIEGIRNYPGAFLTSLDEAKAQSVEKIEIGLARKGTFAAFQDNEPVGIASILPLTNRTRTRHRAEIGAFYVRPVAQGSGVADALMLAMIDFARVEGIWQLELFVAETNTRGTRFYERHGFVREGRLPNAILDGDATEHDMFYVRDLRALRT
ncbi:MAG: GNAT family N-acetyltransferase [Pseudomonadota bacterium]